MHSVLDVSKYWGKKSSVALQSMEGLNIFTKCPWTALQGRWYLPKDAKKEKDKLNLLPQSVILESIAPETEWRIDTEGGEKFKEKLESPYNVDV